MGQYVITITYEDEKPDGSWEVAKEVSLLIPNQTFLHGAAWLDWCVEGLEPE